MAKFTLPNKVFPYICNPLSKKPAFNPNNGRAVMVLMMCKRA